MSPDVMVPAGGIAEQERTGVAGPGERSNVSYRYLFHTSGSVRSFRVSVPARPPRDALLDVEIEPENGVTFMRAIGVDVGVEAENPATAFGELIDAIREWLEYLRDEGPALTPELQEQERFVTLLEYDPGTWFGSLRLRQMLARLGEVRKVLTANGFKCVRARKHEIWARHNAAGALEAKTVLSHGNAEIRTRSLFLGILRQAKKTEDEFQRVLRGL